MKQTFSQYCMTSAEKCRERKLIYLIPQFPLVSIRTQSQLRTTEVIRFENSIFAIKQHRQDMTTLTKSQVHVMSISFFVFTTSQCVLSEHRSRQSRRDKTASILLSIFPPPTCVSSVYYETLYLPRQLASIPN